MTGQYVVLAVVILLLSTIFPSAAWSNDDLSNTSHPTVFIPTFFCTDRKAITSNLEANGQVLDQMKSGCADVRVPLKVDWLESDGSNLLARFKALGWRLDQANSTQKPFIEVRGYVAEPFPEKVLSNIEVCEDFWQKLSAQVAESSDKTVYVYIHGFASSGHNAVYSAGILSANVEGPVVAFTWPSQGSAGLKPLKLVGKKRMRARYEHDLQMIDKPEVLSDLSGFLSELKKKLPVDSRVVLIAHSLGNRLMARYLVSDARESFDKVIFIAADVNQDLFMDVLKVLRRKAKSTVVFANEKDRVLLVSAGRDLLGLKLSKKLGQAKFLVPEIEFIDYEAVAEPTSIEYLAIRHYLPFEHLGSLLRRGTPYRSDVDDFYIVKNSTIVKSKKDK